MVVKFKNSPKGRAFGRVQTIAFYPTVQNNEVFPWTLSPTWHDRIHFFKNRFAFEIIVNSTIGPPRDTSTTGQSGQFILRLTLNWVNYYLSCSSFSFCLVFRFTPIILTFLTSRIIFNNQWMRLSIIWCIMEIEDSVIRRGHRLRRITPSEMAIILHMIRKPNSKIVLYLLLLYCFIFKLF